MGLWRIRENPDPAVIARAQEKVASFTEAVPGCTEAVVAPLYWSLRAKRPVTTTRIIQQHMALKDECLALRVGDASESALVFDFRLPQ
jgi:hypothetical protein